MTTSQHPYDWAAIIEQLRDELSDVQRDIRSYPMPIPACDEQFNSLLERREELSRELARARELSDETDPEIVRDFVRSSVHLNVAKDVVSRSGRRS
ncbi:MAG: hypothetical protein P8Y95_02145 [Gammaproteobacteria bacterium]|jgi:chorismate mutase